MNKPGKRTADYADDTDGEVRSAPSGFCVVNSVTPAGRREAIVHRSSAISHSAKPPTALGQESQNASSPEGAKRVCGLPSGWRWARMTEQMRILAEVERRLSVVVGLEAVVFAKLQRVTCLRQSILQKAFAGELCV